MNSQQHNIDVPEEIREFLSEQPEIVGILVEFVNKYPALSSLVPEIIKIYLCLVHCFDSGHKFFVCGNGGSFADSMHIGGEMLKSFVRNRSLSDDDRKLFAGFPFGAELGAALEYGFPVIVPGLNHSLFTALENDNPTRYIGYAQEVFALGTEGDVLMGISTSGRAKNVLCAVVVAKVKGMTTIGLTGAHGAELAPLVDIAIKVPAQNTNDIQELHLPIYHTICAIVEAHYFKEMK